MQSEICLSLMRLGERTLEAIAPNLSAMIFVIILRNWPWQ